MTTSPNCAASVVVPDRAPPPIVCAAASSLSWLRAKLTRIRMALRGKPLSDAGPDVAGADDADVHYCVPPVSVRFAQPYAQRAGEVGATHSGVVNRCSGVELAGTDKRADDHWIESGLVHQPARDGQASSSSPASGMPIRSPARWASLSSSLKYTELKARTRRAPGNSRATGTPEPSLAARASLAKVPSRSG